MFFLLVPSSSPSGLQGGIVWRDGKSIIYPGPPPPLGRHGWWTVCLDHCLSWHWYAPSGFVRPFVAAAGWTLLQANSCSSPVEMWHRSAYIRVLPIPAKGPISSICSEKQGMKSTQYAQHAPALQPSGGIGGSPPQQLAAFKGKCNLFTIP